MYLGRTPELGLVRSDTPEYSLGSLQLYRYGMVIHGDLLPVQLYQERTT